eukprot:6235584-Amphidinium_carterae.1
MTDAGETDLNAKLRWMARSWFKRISIHTRVSCWATCICWAALFAQLSTASDKVANGCGAALDAKEVEDDAAHGSIMLSLLILVLRVLFLALKEKRQFIHLLKLRRNLKV